MQSNYTASTYENHLNYGDYCNSCVHPPDAIWPKLKNYIFFMLHKTIRYKKRKPNKPTPKCLFLFKIQVCLQMFKVFVIG